MVLVAVLVALVVDRAARRAQQAAQARTEAALLASFSRTVLARSRPAAPAAGAGSGRRSASRRSRSCSARTAAGRSPRAPDRPECTRPEEADVDVAVDPDTHLVGEGRALAAADRRLLDAVAGQALLALRNQQVAAEAAEARRRADATELRTALLSAVGHDLRTPLASIKAAAGQPARPEPAAVRGTTAASWPPRSRSRPTGSPGVVDNLLDSSRLATGAVTPELQPVGYDEVAPLALRGLDGADRVRIEIDERAAGGPRRPRAARTGRRERRRQRAAPRPRRAGGAARQRAYARPRRAAGRRHRPRRAARRRRTGCSPRSSGSATASRAGSVSG